MTPLLLSVAQGRSCSVNLWPWWPREEDFTAPKILLAAVTWSPSAKTTLIVAQSSRFFDILIRGRAHAYLLQYVARLVCGDGVCTSLPKVSCRRMSELDCSSGGSYGEREDPVFGFCFSKLSQ